MSENPVMRSLKLFRLFRLRAAFVWVACLALAMTCLALAPPRVALAADPIAAELHEWSLWIVDPTLAQANAKDQYPNNLPIFVESVRSRLTGRAEKRASPLGMITVYGEPATGLEVELQLASSSRFMAHWPPAEIKSKRVRWLELGLTKTPADSARVAPVEQDHWFSAARGQAEALFLSQGARTDRFLCYDIETPWMPAVKVSGGPDTYQITNLDKNPLEDVFVSVPSGEGRRIGRLKHLPAKPQPDKNGSDKKDGDKKEGDKQPSGAAAEKTTSQVDAAASVLKAAVARVTGAKGNANAAEAEKKKKAEEVLDPACTAEVAMSAVLSADSPEFQEQTRAALRTVLLDAGLKPAEADVFLSLYADAVFKSTELVVLFRLNAGAIEEQFPIVTYPEVKRIVRVPLVLVRNIDPQLQRGMEALVAQLADADYKTRQAAEKRLMEMGRLAIPLLKDALKSADPEVVFRAERMLLAQNESIDGSAANLAAPRATAVNGTITIQNFAIPK